MARIALASFGKPSGSWARDEFAVFSDRLCAMCDFEAVEFKESKRSDVPSRLREEGDAFLKRFPSPQWRRVVLSEEGKLFRTEDFAKWLEPRLSQNVVFLIGSAYGIDPTLKSAADLLWSLSPLTFTHEHARVLLVEQVYRCLQVTRGHPYHHR
jgi:23S rRNA (pseudouridine1915-N3)-methyltransferase